MKDATQFGCDGVPAARGAEWIHRYLTKGQRPAALDAGTDSTAGVPAYINHARWVVDCPDCNGAQLACRTDRRFLCNECGNVTTGGLWRPVVWPADAEAIEAALNDRPEGNQNWEPGQSLDDLQAETFMHKEI